MFDRQAAIEYLVDHYENPRNHGAIEDAHVTMRGGNPGCGDVVDLYLKFDESATIVEQVQFTGEGCTISQASASILTELVKGKTIEDINQMTYDDLIETLGRDVVMSRPKCATLSLTTLKAALRKFHHEQRMREAGMAVEESKGYIEV